MKRRFLESEIVESPARRNKENGTDKHAPRRTSEFVRLIISARNYTLLYLNLESIAFESIKYFETNNIPRVRGNFDRIRVFERIHVNETNVMRRSSGLKRYAVFFVLTEIKWIESTNIWDAQGASDLAKRWEPFTRKKKNKVENVEAFYQPIGNPLCTYTKRPLLRFDS